MKGVCHASFSTIRKFLRDVVQVHGLARLPGQADRQGERGAGPGVCRVVRAAAGRSRAERRRDRAQGKRRDVLDLVLPGQLYTLFQIDTSRGSKVLVEVLGKEFNGVLGCDYFSAYRKYMREFDVLVQFCLAHLIRDVKFLLTLPGREDQAYGQRLRDALRDLFAVIHRREKMTAAGFQQALEAAREQVLKVATTRVPPRATRPEPGEAVPPARGSVLPLHHHAGHRADEQPGRTGDPIRGDRPAHHPGDAERERPPVVRADLDGDRHLRPAGSRGLSVLAGLCSSLSLRHFAALAPAVRPLIPSFRPWFLRKVSGHALVIVLLVNGKAPGNLLFLTVSHVKPPTDSAEEAQNLTTISFPWSLRGSTWPFDISDLVLAPGIAACGTDLKYFSPCPERISKPIHAPSGTVGCSQKKVQASNSGGAGSFVRKQRLSLTWVASAVRCATRSATSFFHLATAAVSVSGRAFMNSCRTEKNLSGSSMNGPCPDRSNITSFEPGWQAWNFSALSVPHVRSYLPSRTSVGTGQPSKSPRKYNFPSPWQMLSRKNRVMLPPVACHAGQFLLGWPVEVLPLPVSIEMDVVDELVLGQRPVPGGSPRLSSSPL